MEQALYLILCSLRIVRKAVSIIFLTLMKLINVLKIDIYSTACGRYFCLYIPLPII